MNRIPLSLILVLIAILVSAGCSTAPQAAPAATTVPATAAPSPSATPAVPAELLHNWKVTQMAIQGGTAITYPNGEITLTIQPDGTLYGNTGCNNYNGPFTLTGETPPRGKGIKIGPVSSTKMYCRSYAEQESLYLNILSTVMAYNADKDQLSMTASGGEVLIFQTQQSLSAQVPARGY